MSATFLVHELHTVVGDVPAPRSFHSIRIDAGVWRSKVRTILAGPFTAYEEAARSLVGLRDAHPGASVLECRDGVPQ